jgi:hypothetical protein
MLNAVSTYLGCIPHQPIKAMKNFFGQILLKLAGNVKNGKNGIQLFCSFFMNRT